MRFFSEAIETMDRGELDALVDERVRYTVKFSAKKKRYEGRDRQTDVIALLTSGSCSLAGAISLRPLIV